MARHWGIPNTTSGTSVGGVNRQSRSHGADTRAELKSVGLPNSGSKSGQLFLHPFEIGSSFLFALVVLLPIALVGGMCLGYAAFAPEPIEYAASFKAN